MDRTILDNTLDSIINPHGYVLASSSRLRGTLIDVVRAAIDRIRNLENEWKEGNWSTLPPAQKEQNQIPVSEKTAIPPALPVDSTVTTTNSGGITLNKLFDAYIERMKPRPQTIEEQKLAVRQFENILGRKNPLVQSVTYPEAELFYHTLKWLPKSSKVSERDLPLVPIAAAMEAGTLQRPLSAGATAAKKLSLISAMFRWGVDRNYLEKNPFNRIAGPSDSNPINKRRSFSPEDITKIFSTPLFLGCQDYEIWRKKGNMLLANHRFWLPLMALYTGARLEEMGQLLISDIKTQDGVLYFHITEEVEDSNANGIKKSVKTRSSVRRVPFHKALLGLGFKQYFEFLKTTNETHLFPELSHKTKKTHGFSQWFNREFRASIGLTDRNRTFHSFRHLFKDECREEGLGRDMHDAISGHKDGSTSAKYGDGLKVATIKKELDKASLPPLPGIPPRKGPFKIVEGIGVVVG